MYYNNDFLKSFHVTKLTPPDFVAWRVHQCSILPFNKNATNFTFLSSGQSITPKIFLTKLNYFSTSVGLMVPSKVIAPNPFNLSMLNLLSTFEIVGIRWSTVLWAKGWNMLSSTFCLMVLCGILDISFDPWGLLALLVVGTFAATYLLCLAFLVVPLPL